LRAFQRCQEHGQRQYDLGDVNVTNKTNKTYQTNPYLNKNNGALTKKKKKKKKKKKTSFGPMLCTVCDCNEE
jgi:hypothetical protein